MRTLEPAVPNFTRTRRLRFAVGALTIALGFVLAMTALYATFAGH